MEFTDKTFTDQSVDLDGNQFFGCTFQRAKLMYYGGPIPHFDSCKFDMAQFMFEKGAGNALEFLRELYHAGLRENVEAFFEDVRRNPPPGA